MFRASPSPTARTATDYDHMAEMLSSIDDSRIVKREGSQLEVAQTSHLGFGPLRLSLKGDSLIGQPGPSGVEIRGPLVAEEPLFGAPRPLTRQVSR